MRILFYVVFYFLLGIAFVAGASKAGFIPDFGGGGVDFINFFKDDGLQGPVGITATALHAKQNESWIGYGTGSNYIRGTSYLSGILYDENNTAFSLDPSGSSYLNNLVLDGVSRNTWPTKEAVTCRIQRTAGTSGACNAGEVRFSGGARCTTGVPNYLINRGQPNTGIGWNSAQCSGGAIFTDIVCCTFP